MARRTNALVFCFISTFLFAVVASTAIPPAEPAAAPAADPAAPAADPAAPAADPAAPAADPATPAADPAAAPAADPAAPAADAAAAPAADPAAPAAPAADAAAPAAPEAGATPPETPVTEAQAPAGICKGGFQNQCVNCRNIAICGGSNEPLITKSCASLNPDTPYCEDGVCTGNAPGATCEADFICSSSGYFPHPESCSKYYLCNAPNGSAHEYDCGPNQVYNAKEYACESLMGPADCKILDCSMYRNSYVRHPGNPAYYAFCLRTSDRVATIVYKCPNEKTSEFNLQTFTCDFKCPKEGRFAHEKCNKFYECYSSLNGLEATEWSCPEDFYYNKKEKLCMLGKCK